MAAERRAKLAPDVLRLKAEGKTNMLIAVNLGISDTTVRRILKEARQ